MNVTSMRRRQALVRSLFRLLVLGVGVFVLAVLLFDRFHILTPKWPAPTRSRSSVPGQRVHKKFVTLPQNWQEGWEPGGRGWFHHADQGTTIMPYEWLVALEQPEIKVLRRPGLFLDPRLHEPVRVPAQLGDPTLNPDGLLPIGWAIDRDFVDPTAPAQPTRTAYNARPYTAVGLTCAACHTGRVDVRRGERPDG